MPSAKSLLIIICLVVLKGLGQYVELEYIYSEVITYNRKLMSHFINNTQNQDKIFLLISSDKALD